MNAFRVASICSAIFFASASQAADLSGLAELNPAQAKAQLQAASAADGYAGALFEKNSAGYMKAFRGALNAAAANTQSFPSGSLTRWNENPSVTLFDRDQRYVANATSLVLQTAASRERVWNGLPTSGYLNTVVVTGHSGLCTGTAVAPNAVITAQHCHCGGTNEFVAVGSIFDGQRPGIRVSRSIPMKACDQPTSKEADIALLILSANLDPSVVPASLASKSLIDKAKSIRVVGFGRDDSGRVGQKLMVDIPMASTDCSGAVGSTPSTSVPDSVYYGCNRGFEMVAGAPLLNKDTCNGDSGGPAFVRDSNGNDYLAGATSRAVATPGARPCGDGGIYVRLDGNVVQWVRNQGVQLIQAP
jgi:hypothetical protein